jgi:FkbM family methyltransferase
VYRKRIVARRVVRHETRLATHDYGGTRLTLELADGLAAAWYDHDWTMPPELARLLEHGLRPGARVFDIGAHQAVVALMLAEVVGLEGSVVAVEAEPHNVRIAERNRVLNDARNLEIVHAAGAARPGTVLFAESLNGHVEQGGRSWGKVRVRALTVDELAASRGRPDVVLVDVEGFEGEVLEGSAATIAEHHATFLVEVHVGHGLDRPVREILAPFAAGYRLLVAPGEGDVDRFVPVDEGADVMAERFFLLAVPT